MRLRHIEVFHAIMRTGSLSKAAQLLCVSQPAVSKVLAHAEHSLGIRLFHRSHGRLHPTREAQLLFDETQKLQTNLDRVSVLARNLALRPGGHLRIGCLPSLGLSIIPHVVEKFRAICPDVSLRIDTRHTKELVTALLTRDLDLAVGIDPPSHPGITAVEVARSRIVIVGAPDKDGRALPNSLEGFVAMANWISIGTDDPLGEIIGTALATHGLSNYAPSIEVRTWYVARALAARGLGHVLLDELTARAPGEPVSICPITPVLSVGVFALWGDGHLDSQAGQIFLDTLRRQICQRRLRSDPPFGESLT